MGRGRAKAKQTKVARELKYSTGGTDLEALRKELASAPPSSTPRPSGWVDEETDSDFSDSDSEDDSDSDDDEDDTDEDDTDDLGGTYGASGSR
jgi:hypothetical protein